MNAANSFIGAHGGFRSLKSYQMSEIVHDGTVKFCDGWIGRRSRTHDQMVQAARSGKQKPDIAANTLICLIHQTNYLLDKQLRQLEQRFLIQGGFTEQLCRARVRARNRS